MYGMNSLVISSVMKEIRLWVKEVIHRSMVLAGEKSAVWTNDIPSSCVVVRVWLKLRIQEHIFLAGEIIFFLFVLGNGVCPGV